MFQTKVVEKTKHILGLVTPPPLENRVVYETKWKNIVEWGSPQMTVCRIRIACWIPKATNTHSSCVILIVFPLPQWLHERASVLRYTYIACLIRLSFVARLYSRPDYSFNVFNVTSSRINTVGK